jgi:hypothetical protein
MLKEFFGFFFYDCFNRAGELNVVACHDEFDLIFHNTFGL